MKLPCFNKREQNNQDDLNRLPSDDHVGDNPTTPSEYRVWLPSAENVHKTEGIKMRTRGEYREGFPRGLVVHWTSGWWLKRGTWPRIFPKFMDKLFIGAWNIDAMAREYALRTCKGGVKNGYNFLVMDVMGRIYQSRSLDKWGYHAGKSYWKGLGYSVSSKLTGVEILNPGKLEKRGDKFFTWYDYEIQESYVRYIDDPKHGPKGYYCMYTAEQEKALKQLCNELMECSPIDEDTHKPVFSFDYVVGHHEVSPGRKSDPGGSLSIPMSKLREQLKLGV